VLLVGARELRRAVAGDALLRAHALRLASIVAVTVLLARLFDLEHGYWVPLTVLAVVQPEEHASRVRAVQRATGTLVGTALIVLLVVATESQWVLVVAQGLSAFGLFALHSRGYFWLVVLLTPTALLTLSAVEYQGDAIAAERAGWFAYVTPRSVHDSDSDLLTLIVPLLEPPVLYTRSVSAVTVPAGRWNFSSTRRRGDASSRRPVDWP
jgi:hypothetical protein